MKSSSEYEVQQYHVPVMLGEAIEGLNLREDGTYVDVTFGGGGHSRAILDMLGSEGRLLAFDQDEDAVKRVESGEWKSESKARFTLINENFRHLKSFLRLEGVREVDGVLADLGVSSHQFDVAERGFSTRLEGELDLRMDRRNEVTARDLVNSLDEEEMSRILKLYGELANARQMARAIVKYRTTKDIVTTTDLKEAVSHHLPKGMENKYLAMLFQALRIEVNGELEALKEMLKQACEVLVPGGRLVVISYHSLEDRLVKNFMKSGNFEGEVEKDFYGNVLSPMKMVSRGAIQAGAEEVMKNSRARSARLRVGEKVVERGPRALPRNNA
ncbi:MAG: 16S rRNA (cytosine(1402)-N(4))-methyltransferase RsmH [Bacteroidales bacterium]|nr:16S rRNA (cytosine(1402)-N(4))-methyltransferase RsmH [Bacteroidales bacterium]